MSGGVYKLRTDVKNKNIFTRMNIRKAGFVIIGVLLVALYFLNRKDIELVKQDSFTVTPIGNSGYQLSSTIHINNPNLLSSTIKTISEKFFIEGKEVALLNIELERGIPGLKETSFAVNVRFSKNDLQPIFLDDTLLTSVKATISVTGDINFQNLMTGGKTSFTQKDSITIPLL